MALLIKSNGTTKEIEPRNGVYFSLVELQKYVDGYIEPIFLNNGQLLVVNEEGGLYDYPQNEKATQIAIEHHALFEGDHIAGDVVFCDEAEVQ